MASLGGLLRELEALEDSLVRCMRCGLCQGVCPVYGCTGLEQDVARGKLALIDGLAKAMLTDAKAVAERLDRCLLCTSCQAACPSGVPTFLIMLRARASLNTFLGLGKPKRLVLRLLATRPWLLRLGARIAAATAGIWGSRRQGRMVQGRGPLRLGGRYLPVPASESFMSKAAGLMIPPAPGRPTVGLFVGCLIDTLFPEVGWAAIDVLRAAGVGVVVPRGQGCCGMPAAAGGELEGFKAAASASARAMAEAGVEFVVSACATCTSAIKHLWAELSDDQVAEQIALKTLDISELLADKQLLEELGGIRGVVAYHDPCHLAKALGVRAAPRQVLRAAGWEVVEPGGEGCCGMGGSFALAHPELAEEIGRARLGALVATGAELIATACPACMAQLRHLVAEAGVGLRVEHVIVLVAEALGRGREEETEVAGGIQAHKAQAGL